MPGSRLDFADRTQIAEGLAQGLSLAEIARRLQRPTSTVSREIARNGGSDAYRPVGAHDATRRRARRSGDRKRPPTNQGERNASSIDATRRYEEEFAAMMVSTGFPRMAARVLACLFTCDAESLSAQDLVRRLRVSPASISKAVRTLEDLALVTRQRDPGQRRERYAVDEDVWYRAWTRRAESFTLWADAAGRGAELLGPDTRGGARLAEMNEFLSHVANDVATLTEKWSALLARRAPVS